MPDPTNAPPDYLSVVEAAEYTGISAATLNRLRSTGGGPIYARVLPKLIRYRRVDLDAWLESRLRRSTFDDRPVAA